MCMGLFWRKMARLALVTLKNVSTVQANVPVKVRCSNDVKTQRNEEMCHDWESGVCLVDGERWFWNLRYESEAWEVILIHEIKTWDFVDNLSTLWKRRNIFAYAPSPVLTDQSRRGQKERGFSLQLWVSRDEIIHLVIVQNWIRQLNRNSTSKIVNVRRLRHKTGLNRSRKHD